MCGGVVELIKAGYETLIDAGYAPEMAYFECLHEIKLIVDLIYEGGIANMNYSISNNAEFGEYVTGPKVINIESKIAMQEALEKIKAGIRKAIYFGKPGWSSTMISKRRQMAEHPIEQIGAKLRSMMPGLRLTN